MMIFRTLLILLMVSFVNASWGATKEADEKEQKRELLLEVDDTNTWVSIAKVHLSIDDLRITQDGVVGDYSLRVPLKKSKNEEGALRLMLEKPLDEYVAEGGVMKGHGKAVGKEGQRLIVATIVPDKEDRIRGTIDLSIETDDRVLSFQSTYRIVGGFEEDSRLEAANDAVAAFNIRNTGPVE